MQAVIFAAGLGTRLRPLTDEVPKPLIDVGGLSILERVLTALPSIVTEAIVVVGYKSAMICERLEGSAGVPTRCVDQPELRGTYDALLRAEPLLDDAPFLALNGDDLYAREDLEKLAGADGWAMLYKTVPTPNPYSHLEITDGRLKKIVFNKDSSQQPARNVYVGGCRLDRGFFNLDPAMLANGELGLPQTLEKHLTAHPVRAVEAAFWMPVGTPEELAAARVAFPDPHAR